MAPSGCSFFRLCSFRSAGRQAGACLGIFRLLLCICPGKAQCWGSMGLCFSYKWSWFKPVTPAPSHLPLPSFLFCLYNFFSCQKATSASSHSDFWKGMKEFLSVVRGWFDTELPFMGRHPHPDSSRFRTYTVGSEPEGLAVNCHVNKVSSSLCLVISFLGP